MGLSLEDSTTSTNSLSVEEEECEKCIELRKQICVLKAELYEDFWLFLGHLFVSHCVTAVSKPLVLLRSFYFSVLKRNEFRS